MHSSILRRISVDPRRIAILAMLALLPDTLPAADDPAGEPGAIKAIHLRSTSASVGAYHNWVVLTTTTGDETYYWGGAVCPGKNLVYAANGDTLVDALAEYATFPDMCITPYYRNGQGGNLCLVAFTAAWRSGEACGERPR